MAAAKGNTYTMNRKLNPQYTEKQIDAIIEKLLKWAYSGKGIHISTFIYGEFKQPKSWIYNLSRSRPKLKEALETARELISGKVTNHSWEGDKNSTFGVLLLPMYCKEYKELVAWKANLAKQNAESIKTTFTEMKKAIADGSLLKLLQQEEEKS